jgi:SAM-dependent methyltransferase
MNSTWSYAQHERQELDLSQGNAWPSCYQRPNSIDAWRHRRMLESTLPLLTEFPDADWLTVGDGKFGSDAAFLEGQGMNVIATSISSHTLEAAFSRGYIRQYATENAESFRQPDNSVDFVLCKESYHHFPRPPVAFYEMLRISRKGIVLIEPFESAARPLDALRALIKRLLRKGASDQFEPSGNFIYRISIREAFKMLTALGHHSLAWKGINDFWHVPFADADFAKLSLASVGTRSGIAAQNLLARVGLMQYGLSALICFKEPPATSLRSRLNRAGYSVIDLPVNPFRSDKTTLDHFVSGTTPSRHTPKVSGAGEKA